MTPVERPQASTGISTRSEFVLSVSEVTCRFGAATVLDDVSLDAASGEIHALLGPNGAGKTTLLRVVAGLISPTSGSASIAAAAAGAAHLLGTVPSGDRTFYLRLSGEENLIFFARLQGMRLRPARVLAREVMERVGLLDAARVRTGLYSHGMLKRLSVARALMVGAQLLLVDEATHDLDPEGARRVRELVADAAGAGTTVVWATQRLDEIRGFADRVTVLAGGRVRFRGSVSQLVAQVEPARYVLRLTDGSRTPDAIRRTLSRVVGPYGSIVPEGDDDEHYLLSLKPNAILGDAFRALSRARFTLLACREATSGIEEAFLHLTGDPR